MANYAGNRRLALMPALTVKMNPTGADAQPVNHPVEDLADLVAPYISAADPWTYVILGSDHDNPTATPTPSALSFTPTGSKTYVVEGMLFLKSAASATGVQAGFQYPTGLSATASGGGGIIHSPGATPSAAFDLFAKPGSTVTSTASAHPSNTGYYPAQVIATVITGGSPSGSFAITVAAEAAALATVTIGAGSWIRYRTIA